MSQEELHSKIENIETEQHKISTKQVVQIIGITVSITISALAWIYHAKDQQNTNVNDLKTLIISNNTDITNKIRDLSNQFVLYRLKDSLEKIQSKMQDQHDIVEIQSHITNLEEKIKNFRRGAVTEITTSNGIVTVPYKN